MQAAQIYQLATAHGIELQADGDNILAKPKARITDDLRQAIRTHKADLLRFLEGCQAYSTPKPAVSAMRVWQYRTTAKPDTWLVMLCPGIDLAEAERRLRNKFADKLLAVREATHDFVKGTDKPR